MLMNVEVFKLTNRTYQNKSQSEGVGSKWGLTITDTELDPHINQI